MSLGEAFVLGFGFAAGVTAFACAAAFLLGLLAFGARR
jgi:hypothetical protein